MCKNQIPCLSDVFDYFVYPWCDDCQLGSGSHASVGFSAPLLWLHSCVRGLEVCNTFPNASCTLIVEKVSFYGESFHADFKKPLLLIWVLN